MKYIILFLLVTTAIGNEWYGQQRVDPVQAARDRVWNQLSLLTTPYPLIDPISGATIPDYVDYYDKLRIIDNLNKPINCNILVSNTIRMIQQYNMQAEQMLYVTMTNNIDIIARFCS